MNQFLLWFMSQVLGPEIASQARQLLGQRNWQRKLTARVAAVSQIRFSRRRFRKWLRRPETANALVRPTVDELEILRESLADALWGKDRPTDSEEAAEDVLTHTTRQFLFALEAAHGVAISNFREMEALADIQDEAEAIRDLLEQDRDFDALLERLPPNVQKPLHQLSVSSPATARHLIDALARAPDPVKALSELTGDLPGWLRHASSEAWVVLGEFAASHRVEQVAVAAFEKAADSGAPDRTLWLARAALLEVDSNQEHSRSLLDRAKRISERPHKLVEIVSHLLDEDWQSVRDSATELSDQNDKDRVLGLALKASAETAMLLWDDALVTSDEVLRLEPLHASITLHKARTIVTSLQVRGSASRDRDLSEAFRLALRARDIRRMWSGPSAEAVDVACQVAILRGDWDAVMRLGTRAPEGEATAREEGDDSVRAKLAAAAITSGQVELAQDLVARIEDPFETAFLEALLNERLGAEAADVRSRYQAAYNAARTAEQKLAVVQALAFLGDSPLPGVTDQGPNNDEETDLVLATSEAVRGEMDSAVPRLRRWTNTSLKATNLLALLLQQAGDLDSAVDVLKRGYDQFNDASLLVRAVETHAGAGDFASAEELARDALASASGPSKVRLRGRLIEFASARNAWDEVERQSRALLEEGDSRPRTRWALALALFNQGDQDSAWSEISRPPRLEPLGEIEAQLLIQLQRRFGKAPKAVREVLQVAAQYPDSEEVGAAAIMAALQLSADSTIPDDLAEELQDVSEAFFSRFPESEYLSRLPFTTVEDFGHQLRDLTPDDKDRKATLARAVERVALEGHPYGTIAAIAGRSYGETLLRRGAGCLPILSPNDTVVEEERRAAEQARNSRCFVDTSVLHTLSLSQSLLQSIVAEFDVLLLPEEALRDLLMARDVLALRSTTSVSWDSEQERIRVIEISEADADDLAERAEWMVSATSRLTTKRAGDLRHFPDLQGDRFAPWLSPLDLAKEEGRSLYADDVGLRLLARAMGVPAFGTLSLVETLETTGRIEHAALEGLLFSLTKSYGVDLPPDQDRLTTVARADNWEPRGAAFAVSRPKFWVTRDGPSVYETLLKNAASASPANLTGWVYAAVLGATRAAQEAKRQDVAGSVLAFSLLEVGITHGKVAEMVGAARRVTEELGVQDPFEDAMRKVSQSFDQRYGAEIGARMFINAVSTLGEDDRVLAMRVLLSASRLLISPEGT
jgi:tetratricopeptide (TPR) repeat protein